MLVAMTMGGSVAFLMLLGFLLSFYLVVIRKNKVNPVIAEEIENINYEFARKHNERLKQQRKRTVDLKVSISFQEVSKEPMNTKTPVETPKHVIENYTIKDYIQNTRKCEKLLASLRHTS